MLGVWGEEAERYESIVVLGDCWCCFWARKRAAETDDIVVVGVLRCEVCVSYEAVRLMRLIRWWLVVGRLDVAFVVDVVVLKR